MWVAPEAESHPEAITMRADAAGVDADVLLQYYLPQVPGPGLPRVVCLNPVTDLLSPPIRCVISLPCADEPPLPPHYYSSGHPEFLSLRIIAPLCP